MGCNLNSKALYKMLLCSGLSNNRKNITLQADIHFCTFGEIKACLICNNFGLMQDSSSQHGLNTVRENVINTLQDNLSPNFFSTPRKEKSLKNSILVWQH